MKAQIRQFNITGRTAFLEVLNDCLTFYGVTYIDLHHQYGIAKYRFTTDGQDTKGLIKFINKTKRSPKYLYK